MMVMRRAETMSFQNGHKYRAPDGRTFIARLENQEYTSANSWTLTPTELGADKSWFDSVKRFLFVKDGRIGYLDLSGKNPSFIDTGWGVGDFELLDGAAPSKTDPVPNSIQEG